MKADPRRVDLRRLRAQANSAVRPLLRALTRGEAATPEQVARAEIIADRIAALEVELRELDPISVPLRCCGAEIKVARPRP